MAVPTVILACLLHNVTMQDVKLFQLSESTGKKQKNYM